jgi:hypothetical protein
MAQLHISPLLRNIQPESNWLEIRFHNTNTFLRQQGTERHKHFPVSARNRTTQTLPCVSKEQNNTTFPCVSKEQNNTTFPCVSKEQNTTTFPCVSKEQNDADTSL